MRFVRVDSIGEPKRADDPRFIRASSAGFNLTADDTDKTIALDAATGATINLPAVADIKAGWNISAYVSQAFTGNWSLVSATAVIQGHAIVAGAHLAAANETTINFVGTAESVGDYVDIFFDGTDFIVRGSAVTAGAITFSA